MADLDQIRLESFGQPTPAKYCLNRGLHHWAVSDESPTYEKIVAVFNGSFLPNKSLARKVENFAPIVETTTATGKLCVYYHEVPNTVQST